VNREFSYNVKSVVMNPVDLVSLRYDLRRHSRVTRALSFAPTVSLNVSSKEGMTHHVSSAESRSSPEVSFLSSVMKEIECASKTYMYADTSATATDQVSGSMAEDGYPGKDIR